MLYAFSVYDKKVESFNTPFFAANEAAGKRAFIDLCRDARTTVAMHPEDFDLWILGAFDQQRGFDLDGMTHQLIMTGVEARVSALKAEKMASELLQVADDPAS